MTCEECGEDKPDVMRRADAKLGDNTTPALCTKCCSKHPGYEWMKASAE